MQKYIVVLSIVCALLIAAVVGLVVWCLRDASDGRGAVEKAQGMEALVGSLGPVVEGLREDNRRAEEYALFLEGNNISLGRKLVDSQAVAGELAVRNRELINYATKLEGQLRGVGVDVSTVAADIGRFIPGAEEGTTPPPD